jgi:hypothetical protein
MRRLGVSDSPALSLLGHEASLLGATPFDDCGEPRLGDKLRAMGLAPGETTLTLASGGPAIVANDVLHNDDRRALGLAVGSWRVERSALVR